MERFNPTVEEGLTVEQVELRKKQNQLNKLLLVIFLLILIF